MHIFGFVLFIGCHRNYPVSFTLLEMIFTNLVALAFSERCVFIFLLLIMFVKVTTFCSSIR